MLYNLGWASFPSRVCNVFYPHHQLCASLGTTGACSFDNLLELGPICESTGRCGGKYSSSMTTECSKGFSKLNIKIYFQCFACTKMYDIFVMVNATNYWLNSLHGFLIVILWYSDHRRQYTIATLYIGSYSISMKIKYNFVKLC